MLSPLPSNLRRCDPRYRAPREIVGSSSPATTDNAFTLVLLHGCDDARKHEACLCFTPDRRPLASHSRPLKPQRGKIRPKTMTAMIKTVGNWISSNAFPLYVSSADCEAAAFIVRYNDSLLSTKVALFDRLRLARRQLQTEMAAHNSRSHRLSPR